ncbi:MAG: CHRD domain-containing protein [Methanobacteriota archaeon]
MSRRVLWLVVAITSVTVASSAAALTLPDTVPLHWFAVLSGAQEVPATETLAWGAATFSLSPDGSTMRYQLIVANIWNVVASHIHLAPAGVNGAVVQFLYGPAAPAGGRLDGVIAQGTFTAASFVGPLAGQPMSALVDAMQSGNAYVNVHTSDGVADDPGPAGDYPGGEIRGQIQTANALGGVARRHP